MDMVYEALKRPEPSWPDRSRIVTVLDRERDAVSIEEPGIRCPLCTWQPPKSSRWMCADCPAPEIFFAGCGAWWHTFDTHGVCPGCTHAWQWTSCLSCGGWSPHDEWYATEPGEP